MEKKPLKVIIVAGETSGDNHGAHLAKELKYLRPHISLSGLGGPQMKAAGVELYKDMTEIAVVGFVEVLKHYGEFKKTFDMILKKVVETKADGIVLIDYPGFNLRLAKKLHKNNIKVIYYISPQVWAWKQGRVKDIKKYVDRMIVLFPFEKEFYKNHGMDVACVGHPFIDSLEITAPKDQFLKKFKFEDYKMTIGLLPGSREKEVKNILPAMCAAAELLAEEFPVAQFLIVKAPSISNDLISQITSLYSFNFKITDGESTNAINACDHCLVASGTATIETALLEKPMVVIYKTSFLTYHLAKFFIKIPYIAMVNVIAQKKIVPECIQHDANPRIIAQTLKDIFTDENKISQMKSDLLKVKQALGESGASRRAAYEIINALKSD